MYSTGIPGSSEFSLSRSFRLAQRRPTTMAVSTWRLLLAIVVVCASSQTLAQKWRANFGRAPTGSTADCGPCARRDCKPVSDCAAGIAFDECGCCSVCAKAENELCEHPALRGTANRPSSEYLGSCGTNLECRLRDDLPRGERPEALCVCTKLGVLCGSDGVTYENMCRLLAASVGRSEKIVISTRGPCRSGKPEAPALT